MMRDTPGTKYGSGMFCAIPNVVWIQVFVNRLIFGNIQQHSATFWTVNNIYFDWLQQIIYLFIYIIITFWRAGKIVF